MFIVIVCVLIVSVFILCHLSDSKSDNSNESINSEIIVDANIDVEQVFDESEESTLPEQGVSTEKVLYEITEYQPLPEITPESDEEYTEQGTLIMELPEFKEFINLVIPANQQGNIVLDDFTVFEDFVQYIYNVRGSDGTFIVEQCDGKPYVFLEFVNRLDSEYPILFFENGLPSNSEFIYSLCNSQEIYGNYTTTYREGELSIELLDVDTNESVAVLTL